MKVLIAKTSGFCHGVRRAMRIALQAAAQHGGLHTDGPLVHNTQAMELLSLHRLGPDQPENKPTLVRAHGISPQRREELQTAGREIIDATCPRVATNQRIAEAAARKGVTILFAGDADHAETKAVAGCAPDKCICIATPEQVEALAVSGPVLLMAQTTFSVKRFGEIAERVRARFPDQTIVNTICRATHDRQAETARLAGQADALVVVGGKHSANTRRLGEVGQAAGIPVHLVETADELRDDDFAKHWVVAVTSGASTPGWITQDVVNRLRSMGRTPLLSQLYRMLLPLVQYRLTMAVAALGYAIACSVLSLGELNGPLMFAGAGYVFFAHTVHRRVPANSEARRLSLVDATYQSHRHVLLVFAAIAVILSLVAGFQAGGIPIALLFAVLIAATLAFKRSRGLRNVPMALGWALALALPAAYVADQPVAGLGAAAFVFVMCLAGSIVRDLHDSVSDHLMGIDSMLARYGQRFSLAVGKMGFVAGFALCVLGAMAVYMLDGQIFTRRALVMFAMAVVPVCGLWMLHRVASKEMHDCIVIQAGVDALGWLAGCIALGGEW